MALPLLRRKSKPRSRRMQADLETAMTNTRGGATGASEGDGCHSPVPRPRRACGQAARRLRRTRRAC
eukprot:1131124-Pleurochrysis_carterae.AAC.2